MVGVARIFLVCIMIGAWMMQAEGVQDCGGQGTVTLHCGTGTEASNRMDAKFRVKFEVGRSLPDGACCFTALP